MVIGILDSVPLLLVAQGFGMPGRVYPPRDGDGIVTSTAGHVFWTVDSPVGGNALWIAARDLTLGA